MLLPRFFTKATDAVTPWPIKSIVYVVGFMTAVAILGSLLKGNVEALAVEAVLVVILVGFWNLKRWAVLLYAGQAAFAVLSADLKFGATNPGGVLAGAALQLLVLGSLLFYWRRMTWI